MFRRIRIPAATAVFALALLRPAVPASAAGAPTPAGLFAGAERLPGKPALETCLGFPAGQRPARFAELDRCLAAWAASDRVRIVEHGRTWEGRPLRLLIVSSPENIARLDGIRDGWNRVADPRGTAAADAERLAGSLPAVAWLGMSIHGDEISGVDAGIVLADHLVNDVGPDVDAMLRDLVVIFDSTQNPDGRERYLARAAETTGALGSNDSQSVQETGSWPYGRGNHYLFDMNRDWVFATQPETRARIGALASWRPLFFLDAHEMGIESTYLFYPPRPPFNPYLPSQAKRWWDRFGLDEASAFDRQGWRYYTGEWADWWFPGYSDSFATFRGAIGILHEQAGVGAGGVKLSNGEVLTYREAVAHQATAAWSNLQTVATHRAEIGRDFAAERRRAVAPGGPLANHSLVVLPDGNRSRLRRFVEDVQRLGGEIDRVSRSIDVKVRDPYGRSVAKTLPEGALIVRGRQPEGALLRATLDFDMPLPRAVLEKERTALVSGEQTLLYDISGWSLPILYGLDAYEVDDELAAATTTRLAGVEGLAAVAPPPPASGGAPVAWVFDGADDASVRVAARLLAEGFRLRLSDKAFELDGRAFPRGSVVALRDDNRAQVDSLAAAVEKAGRELELPAAPIRTGFGDDELPDLGGRHFLPLERPRVALVGYGDSDTSAFGALWFALDRGIGTPTSLLRPRQVDNGDLRRYNVVVLAPGVDIDDDRAKALRSWVEAGGTLIATGRSAAALAAEKPGLSGVRKLSDLPDDLPAYREALVTEWRERSTPYRDAAIGAALAGRVAAAEPAKLPAAGDAGDKEAKKQREQYARRFAPQGTLVASRVDTQHWLTSGAGDALPLFVSDDAVLLARAPVETPVRLGVVLSETAGAERGAKGGAAEPAGEWKNLGWSAVPPKSELALRLSGLLWPEAAERLANSAYLTRESVGSGQVILFAGEPVWRGAALGSARLFANAVVYGPGCGAEAAIVP